MATPRSKAPKPLKSQGTRAPRGRPPTIDSKHLLEVAREVFLEQGIRATALEVADRAGVSEGAVFHRFKSKEMLFRAAMELEADDVPELFLNAVQDLEGRELQEALLRLGETLIQIGRVALPLMMMSWSNPECCGPASKSPRYYAVFKRLAGYFERQMDAGKLRRMDAEVITRAFFGSIHHYCMTRTLMPELAAQFMPEGMFLRGLVDLLLNGASPLPERAPSTSARRLRRPSNPSSKP